MDAFMYLTMHRHIVNIFSTDLYSSKYYVT